MPPTEPTLPQPAAPDGQILIYQDGASRLQVRLEGHTAWLSQRLIAELFQVSVKTANEHLVSIYREAELASEATIRSFRMVQTEGSRQVARAIDHYSLDAILAVGYRVRSARGTAFRQWAMHMADWVQRLDAFLQFNERNILTHAGAVSHQLAEQHAQFERYGAKRRRLETTQPSSDFDRAVEEVERLKVSAAKKAVQETRPKDSKGNA